MGFFIQTQIIVTLLSYTIVANVLGSIETRLQEFKIQEELNQNDLRLIVNSSQQESLLYTKSNNGSRDCVLQHYCCNFQHIATRSSDRITNEIASECNNGVRNCHTKKFKRPINKRIKGCHVIAKEVCTSPCYSCPKFCVPEKEFWCEDQFQITEKIENQIFCNNDKTVNKDGNSVVQKKERTCKILQHRYGGLKQSRSCYEKEGSKQMCTTINCEFKDTGRECNETITTVEVSLTEEVCETCNGHGGVCIKSADRKCFGDPSFETKWVKYCIPDGKDYVKREERSGSDSSLAEIIRPLRRVFDKTAEPVRKLFLKTSSSGKEVRNILNGVETEELSNEDLLLSIDEDVSEILSPSVSNRKTLAVLNDRTGFERHLVGIADKTNDSKEHKKGNILVITATIVKDDEEPMFQPSSVITSMTEKLDFSDNLEPPVEKQTQATETSFVEKLFLSVDDKEGVPEQVRSPIYFDPSINNRSPPSEWKPVELPSELNGTNSSWPPVWYLERSAENNQITTDAGHIKEEATESSLVSSSTTETALIKSTTQDTTSSILSETSTEIVETTEFSEPEKPRTRISTAALARLCLFENVCSQDAAKEHFSKLEFLRLLRSTTSTTTIRTTTTPRSFRRPRKRNPLLVVQLRACMQDVRYCNTDAFNQQRHVAMEGVTEDLDVMESSTQSATTTTTPSSVIEAARSCVQTGDCRKTERIPAEIFHDVETRDEKVKTNRRVVSERTKQQLRTQVRLCLFANIC